MSYLQSHILKLLIRAGANLEIRNNNGEMPLHCALISDSKKDMRLLISAKANLDVQDQDGCTPLHYAAECCEVNRVRLLLAAGANVDVKDNNGETPLFLAVNEDCIEIVKLLIAAKASLDITNNHEETALDLAESREIVEILTSHDPYNHPSIIETKRENKICLGRDALKQTLKKQKVKVQQLLLYREAGTESTINRHLIKFRK